MRRDCAKPDVRANKNLRAAEYLAVAMANCAHDPQITWLLAGLHWVCRPAFAYAALTLRTFAARRPLGPCTTSNSTSSPSERVRRLAPSAWIAV